MILPKFTIRLVLLVAVPVLAAVSIVIRYAMEGQYWAIALCVALLMVVEMFLLYAVTYLLTSPLAIVDAIVRMQQRRPTTPFATSEPPPQILPPAEPE